MASGNITDASVYVDTSALEGWSSQMANINSQAVDILNSFRTSVESIGDSWVGDSATGFLNANENLMNNAVKYHNEMANVEKFLITVVNTVDKS
ncbi:MAG TPA: WXG100 family type VII secretion target [Candidatus Coprovivens excrementavium]|nr:WXG100 family type VII secretion target [Candidatus Coprovivens excrementavium]